MTAIYKQRKLHIEIMLRYTVMNWHINMAEGIFFKISGLLKILLFLDLYNKSYK